MRKAQAGRHPEAPRFHQRGEGSRASHRCAVARCQFLHARSLARLKTVALRDDAILRGPNVAPQDQREEKPA